MNTTMKTMAERKPGKKEKARLARKLEQMIMAVASEFEVTPESLLADGRGRQREADARGVAMFIAVNQFGLRYGDVGKVFGKRLSATVSKAYLGVLRRMREDEEFAAMVRGFQGFGFDWAGDD